jgi:hypothetical protein
MTVQGANGLGRLALSANGRFPRRDRLQRVVSGLSLIPQAGARGNVC